MVISTMVIITASAAGSKTSLSAQKRRSSQYQVSLESRSVDKRFGSSKHSLNSVNSGPVGMDPQP
jgi:hypothetical protein